MKINIKKLTTTAKIPTRGSEYAAGYDLYADITKELVIEPHETAKIGTGLSIEIPDGYFGAVFARSGLAAKQALRPANCVGVCDSDYRDLEGFQQFAYERGVFSRPFLNYMYSMVPYVISDEELIKIFDVMKEWFREK